MSLTAGKWTCPLDLTKEEDRQRLHTLLEGADVVVQAFRRRSLERKGFGLDEVLEMARKRNKGIVYLDLTCYGPDGTYSERPGYQQIADAASGCSYVLGEYYRTLKFTPDGNNDFITRQELMDHRHPNRQSIRLR